MEKLKKERLQGEKALEYREGVWTIERNKNFFIHNHEWNLCVVKGEELNKVIFDINNKTIEV